MQVGKEDNGCKRGRECPLSSKEGSTSTSATRCPTGSRFCSPRRPTGAPNVLMIVWDDVGYGAMDVFGGPIETPNMRRIADAGVRYSNFHTTALCSPTRSCLLTGRNATSNGMACITEASAGFPGFSDADPVRERLHLRGARRARLEHLRVGKWHLTPGEECDMSAWKARWPLGRGFERFYGFLGGETNQWYPGPGLRQPPDRAACPAGGGLPPLQGPRRQGDRVRSRRQGGRAPTSRSSCTSVPAAHTRRTTSSRSGPTGTRAGSTRATRPSAPASWPTRRQLGLLPEDVELSPINPHGEPDGSPVPRASRGRSSTSSGPGTR